MGFGLLHETKDVAQYIRNNKYALRGPSAGQLFMNDKPKKATPAERGMEVIKIAVPRERAEQLRKQAADEGITLQGYLAPVLNSVAKCELRREYVMAAAA